MSIERTIFLTDEQKKEIGYKIKLARILKKMSVAELAKQVRMTEEELLRREDGDFEFYDDFPDYVN